MHVKEHGPYTSNGGHLFVIRTWADGHRKSVWVHREVIEQHLGRKLESWEYVHHKNEDPTDNRIKNLEIMTPGGHAAHHHIEAEMWPITCPECGAKVMKLARRVRDNQIRQKKAGPFCSKSCAGQWSTTRQYS